jgi:ketosteroid isomerase-like protein
MLGYEYPAGHRPCLLAWLRRAPLQDLVVARGITPDEKQKRLLRMESTPSRDTERAMPAESEFLRAFREGFEQGNRAWNAGDVKTAYAVLPDRLEYQLAPSWPEARVLGGRDEVVEFFESFQETFPDARTAPHEYLEGSPGTVIVGFRVTGTGRTSGAKAEMEIWQVWAFPDQDELSVRSVREFTNRREALEAAGLSE